MNTENNTFDQDFLQEGQKAISSRKEPVEDLRNDRDRFKPDARQMIVYDALAHPKFDDWIE